MSTLPVSEYSWSSHHEGFAADRGSLWFGSGYDPYDSATAYAAWQTELIGLLESAWTACVKAPSTEPVFFYLSQGFIDHWYEYLATPDRGHEFFPYG